jgi:iron complex outermembrane receptor protein
MKIFFLSITALFISVFAFSQSIVKGKVTDAQTHKPLAGATISHSGKVGAVTDSSGLFSINCNQASSITISYVGYQPHHLTIKNYNEEIAVALIPSEHSLQEVEISATSNSNKNILYQPASIAKLTPVELKRGTGLFLDDAIQTNVPGVTMNRRSVSGGQQLDIRGYGNGTSGTRGISSNFDGQGYKVYLNGIPVTDAEGITTFDDLDFGSVGDVEITKGPTGTLYGLAIAGAVNLSTIKPEPGKTSIGQEFLMGSYGLQRLTTQLQMGKENASLLVNYGHQQSNGFSIHNKSKKDFANVMGDFRLNDKQSLSTYFGYSNSYDERAGELTLAQFANGDYSGNPEYIKRNAHSNVITLRTGLSHTYRFNSNIANTTSIFGTGFTSNASSAAGWTDKNAMNVGLRSAFETKFPLAKNISLSGITGLEMQRQNAQTMGYNMKADPNDPNPGTWTYGVSPYWVINAATSNVATISKTSSLFTQWTLDLMKDISLTAGVGLSNMKILLNDRFNAALATRPSSYEKSYNGMLSPHIAINKVFNKQYSVYVSYSRGYKAPVSSYFYVTTPLSGTIQPTGKVNDALKPEVGNQLEIGSKGHALSNCLVYELALFQIKFSNKMTTVPVQSTPTTTAYTYVVNGGDQIHKGIEALVKYTVYQGQGIIEMVRPFANLTLSDCKYGDNFTYRKGFAAGDSVNYSNKDVAGVPKIMANLGVDLKMKLGFYANVNYNYKDDVVIGYGDKDVVYKTSSYNLLNGKIGIQRSLGKHFDINAYAGATNITNTKYYQMVFVNQLPDAYVPAPDKVNFFGGVNVKYNF